MMYCRGPTTCYIINITAWTGQLAISASKQLLNFDGFMMFAAKGSQYNTHR